MTPSRLNVVTILVGMAVAMTGSARRTSACDLGNSDGPHESGKVNGEKPFIATGSRISDKQWFRLVESGEYVAGSIYVRFTADTAQGRRRQIHRMLGSRRVIWSSKLIPGLCRVEVDHGVEVEMINAYLDFDEVLYAEPNYCGHLAASPNDTYYGDQWGITSIKADKVWDFWTGDPDFRIAIIDGGVDYLHEDLTDNKYLNSAETNESDDDDDDVNGYVDDRYGWNAIDNSGDITPYWHGTHVAGIVGARGDNNKGTAGVNWQCTLVPILVFPSSDDCPTSAFADGLEYAIIAGCRVSNFSSAFTSFMQCNYDMIEAGQLYDHVVVVAASNDGRDLDEPNCSYDLYPPEYDLENILTVANLEMEAGGNEQLHECCYSGVCIPPSACEECTWDELARASNYGVESVDLAAPGTGIPSTYNETGTGGQSCPDPLNPDNTEYCSEIGTSMATPHVTGAIGLILSAQPYLSWESVVERVFNAAERTPDSDLTGLVRSGGKLNAELAFGTWVDEVQTNGTGTYGSPFNNMTSALGSSGVVDHGTIMFKSTGNIAISAPITIDDPVYLDAWNGSVTIGG